MRKIQFHFRFPIKQVDEVTVELVRGNGPPALNPEFARMHNLTPRECEEADEAAIRSIALEEQ